MTRCRVRVAIALACLVGLAGCGGGGGDGGAANPPAPGPSSGWVAGSFLPSASFKNRCVNPRSGTDPATGQPYADVAGDRLAENNWLRSWSNELYLWYDEIPDVDPGLYATPDYFNLLKTTAITASGRNKDRFHFTYSTPEWQALVQSGAESGYGVEWSVVASAPPRRIVAAYTHAGSPAVGLVARGEEVTAIDGVDVINSNTQALVERWVAGLFPDSAGETHTFTLRNPQTAAVRTLTLVSTVVTTTPVADVRTINTITGRVGYLLFNDHLATAEQQLVNAVQSLRAAGISDLVLDLRYNGGGLLGVASELAYMIAGTVPTAGQTFENLTFNAKHRSINPVTGAALTPVPFYSTTRGYSAPSGQALPTLNLQRVFVLTGPTTCSASESIVNGLRGVNVQVVQIGGTTCGKPYGFYPQDNCGTTYFTIQFKGVNAAGFGDYTDGFTPQNSSSAGGERLPGCAVRDDFGRALGDPLEARLAAALQYRESQTCPAPTVTSLVDRPQALSALPPAATDETDGVVVKTPARMNRLLDKW